MLEEGDRRRSRGRRGRKLGAPRRWSPSPGYSTRSTGPSCAPGRTRDGSRSALDRIAYQLERLDALRRQVRSAMTYPAVVFGLALDRDDRGRRGDRPGVRRHLQPSSPRTTPPSDTSLPLMTQITVGISDFVTHQWYLLIVGAAAVAYGFLRWKKTDRGRASGTASSFESRGSATSSRRSRWRAGRGPSRA